MGGKLMFGIGWSELVVVFCIAIIFIRPKDLPKVFRKVGKLYGQVKKIYAEITATKDQFVKDIEAAAALEEKKEAERPASGNAAAAASTQAPGIEKSKTISEPTSSEESTSKAPADSPDAQ